MSRDAGLSTVAAFRRFPERTDNAARFRFPGVHALEKPLDGALVVKAVHRLTLSRYAAKGGIMDFLQKLTTVHWAMRFLPVLPGGRALYRSSTPSPNAELPIRTSGPL